MKTILRPLKAVYLKLWLGGDMFANEYTWGDAWRIAGLLNLGEW